MLLVLEFDEWSITLSCIRLTSRSLLSNVFAEEIHFWYTIAAWLLTVWLGIRHRLDHLYRFSHYFSAV